MDIIDGDKKIIIKRKTLEEHKNDISKIIEHPKITTR